MWPKSQEGPYVNAKLGSVIGGGTRTQTQTETAKQTWGEGKPACIFDISNSVFQTASHPKLCFAVFS